MLQKDPGLKKKIDRFLSIIACMFLIVSCSGTLMGSAGIPDEERWAAAAAAKIQELPETPEEEDLPELDEAALPVGAGALFDQLLNLPVEENREEVIDAKYRWLSEHAELFPGNTVRNAEGNPELIRFLYCYGQSLDENGNSVLHPELDDGLTPEELSCAVPFLYQWDPRWGFKPYGSAVIGITGCGPTCASMAIIALSKDASATPQAIADFAAENGYYEAGEGTRWALFENIAPVYGLACEQFTVSERSVRRELENGRILVCSMGPGIFTASGHFILISGIQDGKLVVHDPNNRTYSEQLWDYEEIRRDIQAGFSFGYPEPEEGS